MQRPHLLTALVALFVISLAAVSPAHPTPSPYPISWELKFEHGAPQRIEVTPRGGGASEAYWYITFTIANLGRQDQMFLPVFELLTEDGDVIRSDKGIGKVVLKAIRVREKNPHLESVTAVGGSLRVGEDQAKEGVAIWKEPNPKMGTFSIFVTGLSGEAVMLKDSSGKVVEKTVGGKKMPIFLRKTLQLDYRVAGDEKSTGNEARALQESWVMR
jgi:hypothetical protein